MSSHCSFKQVDFIAPIVVLGIEMTSGLNGQEGRFIDEFTIDYATTQDKFVPYVDSRGENKVRLTEEGRMFLARNPFK